MEWLLNKLEGQFAVIMQAPVPFLAAVAIVAVVIWVAMEWGYGRQVENLHSQTEKQKVMLNSYDIELKKATGTGVAQGVDKPKNSENNAWNLSNAQKIKLKELLKEHDEKFLVWVFPLVSSHPANLFAYDFLQVFRDSGWQSPLVSPNWVPATEKGLSVAIPEGADTANPPHNAKILKDFLESAGIAVDVRTESGLPPEQVGLKVGHPDGAW